MHIDLQSEIRHLHSKIMEKKMAFDEGIKKDHEFEELKKIYLEIKELERRLAKCFEHSENIEASVNSAAQTKESSGQQTP